MTDERLKLYMANYIAAIEETRRKLAEHDAQRRRAREIGEVVLGEIEQGNYNANRQRNGRRLP